MILTLNKAIWALIFTGIFDTKIREGLLRDLDIRIPAGFFDQKISSFVFATFVNIIGK